MIWFPYYYTFVPYRMNVRNPWAGYAYRQAAAAMQAYANAVRNGQAAAPAAAQPAAVNSPAPQPVRPQISGKAKASAGSRKQQLSRKPSEFTSILLTEEDLGRIVTVCGSHIENIYDLGAGQKWMLENMSDSGSAFFLQLLFKAVIPLTPAQLRQKVEEVAERRDNLRSAYIYRQTTHPYRVVLDYRPVELSFEDLSTLEEEELDERLASLMAADRRRGFDLERDSLLRIAVYRTKGENSYAMIVSQPHINTDGASLMMLMKDIFVDYALEMSGIEQRIPAFSYKDYAEYLSRRDMDSELGYWKDLLQDLPPMESLPGMTESTLPSVIAYEHRVFAPEIQEGLKKAQGTWHATANSLMQAAWSIMLMKLCGRQDVTFGTIVSGRDAEARGSMMIAGGFVNAIPVRARAADSDETLGSFIGTLQQQILASSAHAHCSPGEISGAIGREGALFDHLLNFHNFAAAPDYGKLSKGPSVAGVRLVDMEMYDNLSAGLTVYFMNENGNLACRFAYDKNVLTAGKAKILFNCFEQVISQFANGSEETRLQDIWCPDATVFQAAEVAEESLRSEIASFLGGLSLMRGVGEEVIYALAKAARIDRLEKDDVIIREKKAVGDVLFVYSGFVELSRKSADGWMRPMMMLKQGRLLSASAAWEGGFSYYEARATNDAAVLAIPGETFREWTGVCPDLAANLMKELETRAAAYSLLWVNAK